MTDRSQQSIAAWHGPNWEIGELRCTDDALELRVRRDDGDDPHALRLLLFATARHPLLRFVLEAERVAAGDWREVRLALAEAQRPLREPASRGRRGRPSRLAPPLRRRSRH